MFSDATWYDKQLRNLAKLERAVMHHGICHFIIIIILYFFMIFYLLSNMSNRAQLGLLNNEET